LAHAENQQADSFFAVRTAIFINWHGFLGL
jgi:hypothetical protein